MIPGAAGDEMQRGSRGLYGAVAAAAVLRVWGITFGLPHPEARPDEAVLIALALDVLRGDLNPEFFNYPSLFIYVLAGLAGLLYLAARASGLAISLDHFAATMVVDATPLYLCARLMSVACGVATVAVVYALGRRLQGHRTGVAAAWLLAVNYLHVRESHFGVTDIPLTLLTVAAVAAAVRASQTKRTADFAIAGAIAGLAVSTKYNALLLALPLLVAAIAPAREPRKMVVHAAIAGVVMLTVAVAATPFAVLDWETFLRDVQFEMRHLQVGHAGVDLGRGWVRHATWTLPIGSGVAVLVAAIVGAVSLLWRQPWLGLLSWSFPIVYYFVAGSTSVVFVRYMAPMIPFIAVAAAAGIVQLVDVFAVRASPRLRIGAIMVALMVLMAAPLGRAIDLDRVLSRTDSRVIAERWLSRELTPGASVYQAGSTYEHLQLPEGSDLRAYDAADEAFVNPVGVPMDRPDWIVLPRSASPYSVVPAGVDGLVARCYERMLRVPGAGVAPAAAFDLQDAFFVPYADPAQIERPGPDIDIYIRNPAKCGASNAPGA